jgi:hypothetical protein
VAGLAQLLLLVAHDGGERVHQHQAVHACKQCSGFMTFWCGSGSRSADPCL